MRSWLFPVMVLVGCGPPQAPVEPPPTAPAEPAPTAPSESPPDGSDGRFQDPITGFRFSIDLANTCVVRPKLSGACSGLEEVAKEIADTTRQQAWAIALSDGLVVVAQTDTLEGDPPDKHTLSALVSGIVKSTVEADPNTDVRLARATSPAFVQWVDFLQPAHGSGPQQSRYYVMLNDGHTVILSVSGPLGESTLATTAAIAKTIEWPRAVVVESALPALSVDELGLPPRTQ